VDVTGQRLAESGARLTGLDIAAGPVAGLSHRLRQGKLSGAAIQGSVLAAPLPDRSFDVVIAIGCFHHTGNIERAIAETARILRRDGRATIMSYSATSYLRWLLYPVTTVRYLWSVRTANLKPLELRSDERPRYDINSEGMPAPETVLVSPCHFPRILEHYFGSVAIN
jgi:ubiquinone/menaquinone biosynthesis C-methylase UbiE